MPGLTPYRGTGGYCSMEALAMSTLRTGELAERAGVNVETLRFYERKGLLPQPPRRRSGYRQYPAEAVERIRFIKRTQELGFTLKEIDEMLGLRVEHGASCADVTQRIDAKLAEIARKIADLNAMKCGLQKIREVCPGRGSTDECPILNFVRFNEAQGEASGDSGIPASTRLRGTER